MKMRRVYRDVEPRSLSRFRREVMALLIAGHRFTADTALKLVAKWDGVVRSRHAQGKPPCNVADHLARYEREKVVCPCSSSRDPDKRCRKCRRKAKTSRDPECVLIDRNARTYGYGDRKRLARKGRRGQSVMCRAKHARDLVDVYPVRKR